MTSSNAPVVILNRPGSEEFHCFQHASLTISANTGPEIRPALRAMQAALERGKYLAGWFTYEFGNFLQAKPDVEGQGGDCPLLWFGVFDAPATFGRNDIRSNLRAYAGPLEHEWNREAYRSRFERIKEHIRAGDIYQANLSFRSRFAFAGDPLAFYLQLLDRAKVPHAAYIDSGPFQVLSLSPELFFELSAGVITAQPMKGTTARSPDIATDAALSSSLLRSTKNCAENVMIVDLMRNDLGRLALPGTVRVPELFGLRSYPTFHTLVSTVTAVLPGTVSLEQLLTSLFPAGSITGAPKLRAMEVLRSLESSPRDIYCGAIGYFAPQGDASFNVAIRTLWLEGNRGMTGVGGGVVADSDATQEFDECLIKARWFETARRPIGLLETLRWDRRFMRLDAHLARMACSALYLSLPFSAREARHALEAAIESAQGTQLVRLKMNEAGEFSCNAEPLGPNPPVWRFAVSPEWVDSRDVLLAHKTTWREFYDRPWKGTCESGGLDEVLFVNERGELTEGSRSNFFVRREGQLLTPSKACGLLPGILRSELLRQSLCRECILTMDDLASAEQIFFGNSARGLIRAVLSREVTHAATAS